MASPYSEVRAGSLASAENVTAPTNLVASGGKDRRNEIAAIDQQAKQFYRLIGGDAASDTEDDARWRRLRRRGGHR